MAKRDEDSRAPGPYTAVAIAVIVLALVAIVAGLLAWRMVMRRAAVRPLALVVSGDTAGWIMPCGCASNQSGGLARRATYIHQVASGSEVIVADVGGAPSGTSPYDRVKFAAILDGELAMGLAAHNLGAAEVALGAAELQRLAAEKKVPFVSANVRGASGELVASPLKIIERANLRVAISGVLSPRFSSEEVQVADPKAALLEALSAARGQYDSAVILAYLPADELQQLAAELPEVDVVVGGPTRQSISPQRTGPTLFASVTNKGKFLAHLAYSPDRVPRWEGRIAEVESKLNNDAAQMANLERFQEALAKEDFAATETGFAPALPDGLPDDYQIAGTMACQKCHEQDCGQWNNSGHAKAWTTLTQQGAHVDSYCQQCHTTGYGLPGGFVSAKVSHERVAVGCESCHGPSLVHSQQPATKTTFAARDQCVRCHDRENSPQFAYDSYWPRIRHGEKLQAATAAGSAAPTAVTKESIP